MHQTTFSATRIDASDRLRAFTPSAAEDYARLRNTDPGPEAPSHVSRLSPAIRYRLISEQEVCTAVMQEHGWRAAEKFIQEVCWRTYWKGWLEMRPSIWRAFERQWIEDRNALSSAERRIYERAVEGRTGIDGFDAWAIELAETGYLHNHARMWFASIWIHTLRLPWTLGARFFLEHLLDADPASNTLSWRWVAGIQTLGKVYLATNDNVRTFTLGRYSPMSLSKTPAPIEAKPHPKPVPIPNAADQWPEQPYLLFVHPDDLSPETLTGALPKPAATAIVSGLSTTSSFPWGEKAKQFLEQAVEDAAKRLSAMAPVLTIEANAEALVEAARDTSAACVATAYAPVGAVADWLNALEPVLARANLPLVRVRRQWDSLLWPHATKGFFPFKERLPDILPPLTAG